MADVNNFFENSAFYWNKFFMEAIGQWPFQKRRARIISSLLVNGVLCVLFPTVVHALIKLWGPNINAAIQTLPPILTFIACMIKRGNYSVNESKIKRLLLKIKADYETIVEEEEHKILSNYGEKGRSITKFYSTYIYMSVVIFSLTPMLPVVLDVILPANETRTKRLLYPADYGVDGEKYWYWFILHENIGTISAVTIIVAADTMFISLVCHGCGLFAIVRYKLKHIVEDIEIDRIHIKEKKCKGIQDLYEKRIKNCIIGHDMAIQFFMTLESSFIWSFFMIVGINMIIISITGLQIIMRFGEWEDVVTAMVYTGAQLIHLFFLSLPGQFLIDESGEIRNSAYQGLWYKVSAKAQKLLILILMRSKKPCEITAGKFLVLKMETFSTIVQTSMSYLTVLASFQ